MFAGLRDCCSRIESLLGLLTAANACGLALSCAGPKSGTATYKHISRQMLRTCFVARLVGDDTKSVDIFCRFEPNSDNQEKLADLPSAQNLGAFCFPVGPANVKAKEYGAMEVGPAKLIGDFSLLSDAMAAAHHSSISGRA